MRKTGLLSGGVVRFIYKYIYNYNIQLVKDYMGRYWVKDNWVGLQFDSTGQSRTPHHPDGSDRIVGTTTPLLAWILEKSKVVPHFAAKFNR